MTAVIAVVDTNVVVSGLLTMQADAPTAWILDGILTRRFAFLLSIDLLTEYRAVLLRPGIRKRHQLTEREIDAVLTDIAASGQVKEVESGLLGRGDGDEHLRVLLAERADAVLVTGDTTLRARLPPSRSLSPKAFADRLASAK